MAKQFKSYKRSGEVPVALTEGHKKAIRGAEVTSAIIRYMLISVVLLSLIFSMLALFKVEVTNDQLDTVAAGKDKFANISSFDIIGGWFAKSSYNYADRGINVGYQYPHVFDYIVGEVPALKTAVGLGDLGGGAIFGAITAKQDKMLDSAYIAMLVLEIISLVWLVAMGIMFALTFVKKMCPSGTMINTAIIINFVLNFIMFAITLGLSSNSTAEFAFSVGVGMWLIMLISVILMSFVIANIIYNAKVKAYEVSIS